MMWQLCLCILLKYSVLMIFCAQNDALCQLKNGSQPSLGRQLSSSMKYEQFKKLCERRFMF